MAKCKKCGKKIEYNAFVVIDGKVYCPVCVVEKAEEAKVITTKELEVAEETREEVKAMLEAEEQFEKEMGVDEVKQEEPEEIPKKKRGRKKSSE